jgi:flagellin
LSPFGVTPFNNPTFFADNMSVEIRCGVAASGLASQCDFSQTPWNGRIADGVIGDTIVVIKTNLAALKAAMNLNNFTRAVNKSLARLSSGSKIVSASDNPAGLAQSIRLKAQIAQTTAANNNISNALSFSQTQDGYLQQVGSALSKMAALAVQAQDNTKSSSELGGYQTQFTALAGFVTSTASKKFNGVSLFNSAGLTVTTDDSGSRFTMAGVDLNAPAYANAASASIASPDLASAALGSVAGAIAQLATDRAKVGASQQRLNFTSRGLNALSSNLTSAMSQITDVDVAQETTNYTKRSLINSV